MTAKIKNGNSGTILFAQTAFAFLLLFWILAATAGAQTASSDRSNSLRTPAEDVNRAAVLMPVLKGYKEIQIGMTEKEVRERLGKPEVSDKDGFYYQISDNESVQIGLDSDKTVRVISAMYSGKEQSAPSFEDVFGKDVPLEEKADKSIYKLIRYPQAGYWVAYSRTAGDAPIVVVTIQKMWDANDRIPQSN